MWSISNTVSFNLKSILKSSYTFKWVDKYCHCLGINIPVNTSDLFKVNFEMLHNKIKTFLLSRKGNFFSVWLDRIHVLKTSILLFVIICTYLYICNYFVLFLSLSHLRYLELGKKSLLTSFGTSNTHNWNLDSFTDLIEREGGMYLSLDITIWLLIYCVF